MTALVLGGGGPSQSLAKDKTITCFVVLLVRNTICNSYYNVDIMHHIKSPNVPSGKFKGGLRGYLFWFCVTWKSL